MTLHAHTFFDMVTTVRAHIALAVAELGGVPEKPVQKQLEEGRLQVETALDNMRARAAYGAWYRGDEGGNPSRGGNAASID